MDLTTWAEMHRGALLSAAARHGVALAPAVEYTAATESGSVVQRVDNGHVELCDWAGQAADGTDIYRAVRLVRYA